MVEEDEKTRQDIELKMLPLQKQSSNILTHNNGSSDDLQKVNKDKDDALDLSTTDLNK